MIFKITIFMSITLGHNLVTFHQPITRETSLGYVYWALFTTKNVDKSFDRMMENY